MEQLLLYKGLFSVHVYKYSWVQVRVCSSFYTVNTKHWGKTTVYSEMLAEENAQPTKTKRLSTSGLSFASSLGDLARAGKCLSVCGLWHAQVTQPLLELQALSSATIQPLANAILTSVPFIYTSTTINTRTLQLSPAPQPANSNVATQGMKRCDSWASLQRGPSRKFLIWIRKLSGQAKVSWVRPQFERTHN